MVTAAPILGQTTTKKKTTTVFMLVTSMGIWKLRLNNRNIRLTQADC